MTVRIEYKTRVEGAVVINVSDLKTALEYGYKVATTMPLDPDYLPIVSVFDQHGFVAKIDRIIIETKRLQDAIKTGPTVGR